MNAMDCPFSRQLNFVLLWDLITLGEKDAEVTLAVVNLASVQSLYFVVVKEVNVIIH